MEAAIEQRKTAAQHFEEVMHAVPRGIRLPDERILVASAEYTAAQKAVTAALLAMNNFLGITDSRSEPKKKADDSGQPQV